jgi:hypothetical protein
MAVEAKPLLTPAHHAIQDDATGFLPLGHLDAFRFASSQQCFVPVGLHQGAQQQGLILVVVNNEDPFFDAAGGQGKPFCVSGLQEPKCCQVSQGAHGRKPFRRRMKAASG